MQRYPRSSCRSAGRGDLVAALDVHVNAPHHKQCGAQSLHKGGRTLRAWSTLVRTSPQCQEPPQAWLQPSVMQGVLWLSTAP